MEKKTGVVLGVAGLLALSGAMTTASAVAIADGSYTLVINISPDLSDLGYPTVADVGTDGAWNTSLTVGLLPATGTSNGMFDEALSDVFGHTTIAGNGNAGEIGIVVSGGNISVTSFQVDSIGNTCCGTIAQYAYDASILSGTTTFGETSLDFSGRQAAMSVFPVFTDKQWGFNTFTTGSSTNIAGTVNGTPVANAGDLDGDGIDDYTATFVSAGAFTPEWGDFNGTPIIEVWNTQILSASPVPVPAAVWLFGSGLVGLLGLARYKN
ncbi:MAG: hypothetical protein OEW89_01245 [Gammaproteobacteria bacterium]|nr:hypothetical protein [Gammaproteobacteria bacterium]MDH5594430.1 hypothetical protein [Gammaproteobacteria bacterium]